MGIFVGNQNERASFRSSGGASKLAQTKGRLQMLASKSSTQVPNAASGIVKLTAKATAAGRVASAIAAADKVGIKAGYMQNVPASGNNLLDKAMGFVKRHPVLTAGAAALGGAAIATVIARRKKKKKAAKKKASRTRSRSSTRRRSTSRAARSRRRAGGFGTEAQYKRKGGLDVQYTKNGQPYVIQSNGRARFIKRSR